MARKTTKPKADATPAAEEEAFVGTHVVHTARGLNLRKAPGYGAPVAAVLPVDTTVQETEAEGVPAGWIRVMTEDGKTGFVAARYISHVKE